MGIKSDQVSYYIDTIEKNLLKVKPCKEVNELWLDLNTAFEIENDIAFIRKLRVLNERLNKLVDSQKE